MRKTFIFVAGLLLAGAAAGAQESGVPTVPNGLNGSFDIGLRSTQISGDSARFQRFRDIKDGTVADAFRFEQRGDAWLFEGGADHLGLTDQRLFGTFRAAGKVKASFSWDELPLFISGDTRTLFQAGAPGVYRLDGAMRRSIESGGSSLANYAAGAVGLDIRSRRRTAAFGFLFTPRADMNVNLSVRRTLRDGTMPFGASFGFNDAVELAAPIDTKTTDVNTGAEWSGRRGMVRVAYDGSWFTNDLQTLVWDNPLKITDSTSATFYQSGLGGSQGRTALPPSSTMQGVTTAGALKLPASTRLGATITVGNWRQNERLLPATINSAIPAIPLPRDTAEAEARTLAMNYTFSSQPSQYLWLNARYRYYDFDNRTPIFHPTQFVVFDQTAHDGVANEPFGFIRQNADFDVTLTPSPFTAFRVGYSRAADDRTFRIFERTVEETYRSSIDLNAGPRILVRGIVERSNRIGSAFDEELLLDVGEQPEMRHFDVADRARDRATGLLQVTASKYLGFTASAAMGKDDYENSGFGLRNNENRAYTLSADFSAGAKADGTLSYVRERYSAAQASRTASPGTPQVTDPTRDWFTDSSDSADTWNGSFGLVKVIPRTELRVGYDFTRSHAAYVYRLPADTTLAALVQLPTIRNERRTATSDVRFSLTKNLGVGFFYWHEAYTVDDYAFAERAVGSLATPGSLFLGYVFRPYTADSSAVRLLLTW